MSNERSIRARRLKWAGGVAGSLAAVLFGVATLATAWLVRPDLMLVEHVQFEGAERATVAALRHLSDVRNGTTIWSVDADAAAVGVRRHPWVRAAHAEVQWPDTLVVTVEEFVPKWAGGVAGSLAAVLFGVATLATAWLVRPDLMLVEHVQFEGAERATVAALRHLSDVRNGTTIWSVDADAAAVGVRRHPWVRAAHAEVQWPDTLVVTVEEFVPVATVLLEDGLYYVDSEGTPFVTASGSDLDFPIITGLRLQHEGAHPDLARVVVREALSLVSLLDDRGLLFRRQVSEVSFSETVGLTVHAASGARVAFGLQDVEARVDRLAALITEGVSLAEPLEVDLAPEKVAIVRPVVLGGGEG